MQSHYVINVSKLNPEARWGRYNHLFATAEHSCVTREAMQRAYEEIRARFPEPEFHVEVTYWSAQGRTIAQPTQEHTV